MLGVKKSVDPVARRRAMLRLYTSVIAGVALTVIVIVAVLSLSKRNDTLAVIANLLWGGNPNTGAACRIRSAPSLCGHDRTSRSQVPGVPRIRGKRTC